MDESITTGMLTDSSGLIPDVLKRSRVVVSWTANETRDPTAGLFQRMRARHIMAVTKGYSNGLSEYAPWRIIRRTTKTILR